MMVDISKFDAAKRELEHAIRLFFCSGDIVVIHLVSSSAQAILIDVGRTAGATSIKDELNKRVKKDKIKYVQGKLSEAYNFFKHANKDKNKLLKFYPASSEFVIWDSVNLYQNITKEITGLMMAFRLWFWTKNKDLLLKSEDQEVFNKLGTDIDINNRTLFLKAAEQYENFRTEGNITKSYED